MKKIKLKTLYLIGIITIGLIGLGIGSTYAMFTSDIEIDNPISISTTLTSESDVIETFDIEVESNDIEVIKLNIVNGSTTSLNYSSFYITDNKDIEVGVTHNFSDSSVPTGNINSNENKKVYIQIKNNSSSKEKVIIGVLSNSGNIVKSDEMILVPDNNIDTTSPEILITGQDMIVKDGLIRYYNAINNLEYSHSSNTTIWKDLSGNYDGEVNDVTWNDKSASFNGTSSNVNIGQIREKEITLEVYFKYDNVTSEPAQYLISNVNDDLGITMLIDVDSRPRIAVYDTEYRYIYGESIATGAYYNLTGTYDGTNLKLYLNSILIGTLNVGTVQIYPNDTTSMVIGCDPNIDQDGNHYCFGDFFAGTIYSARVYNRVLTEEEIKQNIIADRISSGDNSPDVNGTYTFISNKKLNNFTSDNIIITNGTKGTFTKINDRKYNLDISGVTGSSTMELNIPINNFEDISGNKNSKATILSKYLDNTGPIATITKNTSASRTVTYTFTFHEYTYGFTSDDITISEGTKGTFTKVNQGTYTLVVNHATDGSKTITVNAGTCYDLNGNLNSAKSLTHTINTALSFSITDSPSSYTVSGQHTLTIKFNRSVIISKESYLEIGVLNKVSDNRYGINTVSNSSVIKINQQTYTTTYTFDKFSSTVCGVRVQISAGFCKDLSGNENTTMSRSLGC